MLGIGEIVGIAGLLVGLYLLIRPPSWLVSIKNRRFISEQGGIYEGRKLLENVRSIGTRLVEKNGLTEFQISFHVLKSSKVVNAFALPSGQIYLTLGIIQLDNEEEKIAATLAHEIAHVVARHHIKRTQHSARTMILAAALPGGLFGKLTDFFLKGACAAYSQEQELEADTLSINYLRKAGYSPMAAYHSLKRLYELPGSSEEEKRPFYEFLTSHPISEVRLKSVLDLANQGS